MTILLGAIADDFTGATDLANTLVQHGMRTVQTIGIPGGEVNLDDADAIVVALKSRTSPAGEAVAQSVQALEWLQARGARQFFFKYCSTFDSTADGNIGPVADALFEALGAEIAIVCPAFPTNGRTIFKGHLFVGDDLLSESSMKDHPLTPMRDSSLVRLMRAQSQRTVGLLPYEYVRRGGEAIAEAFSKLRESGVSHVIVDAITDPDLDAIGEAVAGHVLLTGGSGVARGLPENFRRAGQLAAATAAKVPAIRGRSIVLAGSCSTATRAQIAAARKKWPCLKLDPDRVAAGDPVVEEVLAWAHDQSETNPILVYGSADPDEVMVVQSRYGRSRAGEMMEEAISLIAKGLVAGGARRVIVAGGETSGAVVSALGVTALRIGAEIAPGVPWTETVNEPGLALALKSGNFGQADFFERAFRMLP